MNLKLPMSLLLSFLLFSFLFVPSETIFAQSCPRGELGNLNCDSSGIINQEDLKIMLRCWRNLPAMPVCDLSASERNPNISGDPTGLVDEADMQILLANWDTVGGNMVDFYGNQVHLVKVFGAKNFGEASQDTVVANKIDHAPGVLVDTSARPNRIYAVDTGNNRVLGFASLGVCSNQPTQRCTNDTDCSAPGLCNIDVHKGADLIFGQPDDNSAACNGDVNLGIYRDTSASRLCFLDYPAATNTGEYWMRINFDVDTDGNLYVPDTHNNRIVKYNQPFSSDKSGGKGDTIADFVIGQDNFSGHLINHGLGKNARDSRSLYTSKGGFDHVSSRGVSVDRNGNVWVADTFNFRVLRFPPGSKTADLVIGQADFSSADTSGCLSGKDGPRSTPLSKICTPTLARIDPDSGNLYVIDEHPGGFYARILVYNAPFTNGEPASRAIYPNQDGPFINYDWSYSFQATGFVFNPYKEGEYANGKLWVNEHEINRTVLLDDSGNIIKVVGAPDQYHRGCDYGYYGRCKGNDAIFRNFNLCWPGGNIGFDNANNIYLADEQFSRVSRFSLPYNTTQIGQDACVPDADGGLFDGNQSNAVSGYKFRGGVGTFTFGNQLIVKDQSRFLVWNDYMNKENGAKSDFVIGQASDDIRAGNYLGMRAMHAVDDHNRLWALNGHGKLIVYQLPFHAGDEPLANFVKLYWADSPSEEVDYQSFEKGIGFDPVGKALWVIDNGHRLFRIKNYSDFANKLYVDMVIGQPSKTTVGCNHGLGTSFPSASRICVASALEFDKFGNMFVVDNYYEGHGNMRIVMYAAEDLAFAEALFPQIEAKKVFVRKTFTETSSHDYWNFLNEPCSPISVAFNSKNQMVVGNDGYYGNKEDRHLRQLWYYNDPLKKDGAGHYIQGQLPDAYINLPMGAPGEINFDNQDNLIIQDHTWAKVWVINLGRDPSWLIPVNQ